MARIYTISDKDTGNKHIRVITNQVAGDNPLHMHEYFEIELITKGKCKQVLNGTTYDISPRVLYFLSPVDFHKLYNVEESVMLYNVSFDHYFSNLGLIQTLISKNNVIMNLDTEENGKCERIIELLSESTAINDKYTERNIKNLLECLLIFILRHINDEQTTNFISSELSPIQTGLQYIYLHYRENPSVEEVSKKCGYSTEHFCRQFKNTTGKTYTRFINLLKINYAKITLLTSKTSVIEVAEICGFTSISNFNRVFKSNVGVSPSEFIKQNEKRKQVIVK